MTYPCVSCRARCGKIVHSRISGRRAQLASVPGKYQTSSLNRALVAEVALQELALGNVADSALHTWMSARQHVGVNSSLLLCRGMQLFLQKRLDGTSIPSSHFAIVAGVDTSALDGQSLIHDRASPGNELEVGDGTATRGLLGGGGERAQGSWAGLLQKGTHALRLTKEGLHVVGVYGLYV